VVVFLAVMCLIGQLPATRAEDFRIATKIYLGDSESPISETTTLFLEGVVYDFLEEPPQVAVFRKPSSDKVGRFILLSSAHKIRTELTTDKISGAVDKLRTWARRQRDPFLKFAADPLFEESFTADSGKLVLASHLENYTVATAPAERPQALTEYREFLDWYARLNTLLSAGPPPEPRLRLNAALARYNVIPLQVELTRAGDKEPLRAEHQFTWRLSQTDLKRIDEVRTSLASYSIVSNEEFLRRSQSDKQE